MITQMKTQLLFFALAASAPAILLASPAADSIRFSSDSTSSGKFSPPTLQVVVSLAAGPRDQVSSDEIEQNVADYVSDALRQQGFGGKINYLDSGYEPSRTLPVLAVKLVEWRIDGAGNAACTFSATIATAKGEKDLGLFTGTAAVNSSRADWFSRANAFEQSMHEATGDLYKRVAESNQISVKPAVNMASSGKTVSVDQAQKR
jgi:hypothetical protein